MIITAGKFKGQKVQVPDENITRPTLSKVRMSIFNTLQAMLDFEGSSFLDMYAGSGIMGLEALSRGFSKVVAFEKSNFRRFNPAPKLIFGDSLKSASKMSEKFDVIYIDPPYFSGIYEKSLEAIRTISFGVVILEHVVDVDFGDFEVIKQKKYGDKFVTFLKLSK